MPLVALTFRGLTPTIAAFPSPKTGSFPVQALIDKAEVLHEALPYIRRFRGKTFVVKYGGSAMTEPHLREGFARDIVLMHYVGVQPVVVHGGGPQIDRELTRLGIASRREEGLRITDERTMDVVERVLGGDINREITGLIEAHGGHAVGMGGGPETLLRADKLAAIKTQGGALVDPGRVGKIAEVRVDALRAALAAGAIPVVAPIGRDGSGRALNVNADTAAGAIAAALGAEKFLLLTDTPGVCRADGSVIASLTACEVARLRESGVIAGGMIPKVECALRAVVAGVAKCHVVDGRVRHAILLEIFTDHGIGTEIVGEPSRSHA